MGILNLLGLYRILISVTSFVCHLEGKSKGVPRAEATKIMHLYVYRSLTILHQGHIYMDIHLTILHQVHTYGSCGGRDR